MPKVGDRGAEDFADADLLGAALGYEGGETEEPQAGDEDGEAGEYTGECTDALLSVQLVGVKVVYKTVVEGGGWIILVEDGGDFRERWRDERELRVHGSGGSGRIDHCARGASGLSWAGRDCGGSGAFDGGSIYHWQHFDAGGFGFSDPELHRQ